MLNSDFLAEIKRTKSTWAKLKAVVRKTGDKLQIEVLEMYKSRPSFPTIKEEEQDSETEDATQPVPPSFPARSNDDDLLRRVVKRVKTERSEPLSMRIIRNSYTDVSPSAYTEMASATTATTATSCCVFGVFFILVGKLFFFISRSYGAAFNASVDGSKWTAYIV